MSTTPPPVGSAREHSVRKGVIAFLAVILLAVALQLIGVILPTGTGLIVAVVIGVIAYWLG